ncbi:putative glycolipid-binding domain-containing protein [Chelativorans sp. M5D2P16]|uniref:putative glycolipid-binding domain-containing protein n=1 Tax=Chelativorans sp. M5D2P16 TaxID=3095678 RepID=UPI002AC9F9F3|nr:putative glycolipid-binding domain-containing protein [Chelativorans sp. M5D2P16]MDZ5698971.1 putative glycolipid-binding domain-containing protein [Chelativorans sp. M5D2P16]
MERESEVIFWRRTDMAGLERLTLAVCADAVYAVSSVICVEDGGYRIDHRWKISPDWRALSLEVEKWGAGEYTRLTLERAGKGWKVDGMHRPDLDGADEPDLSVTPFCNTFPIQRLKTEKRESLTLETCYIDAASMTVACSRQRYDRLRPNFLRYIDLGLSAGFEADLQVDDRGLIVSYQDLFERVAAR